MPCSVSGYRYDTAAKATMSEGSLAYGATFGFHETHINCRVNGQLYDPGMIVLTSFMLSTNTAKWSRIPRQLCGVLEMVEQLGILLKTVRSRRLC